MEVSAELFDAYEFTFAGESSLMYGLMLYDFDGIKQSNVSFGNTASVIETRTNRRVRPIHFGVNYNTSPLQFKLVFGAMEPIDRYDMEIISLWLTGHQDYQWLSIEQPDLDHAQFRCLITQLTPLHHGWLPVAFEATVLCDCPYAYGYPFEYRYQIDDEKEVLFRNDSSVREYIKPILTYHTTDGGDLCIINHSDGEREFSLSDFPAESNAVIDNDSGIIQETNYGYNLYSGFNSKFFRLIQGNNKLTIIGNGDLTISGRLMYNVAG